MNIGEFFVSLGVKADTYTVKDFSKSLMDLPLAAAGAIGALAGVELGLMAIAKVTLDVGNNLSLFSAKTGLSTAELQRWQGVARQVGVSADTVTGSVMGISNAMTGITSYAERGPAEGFGRLGIDWYGKTPFEVLDQMRKRYKSMDRGKFRKAASMVGVNDDMMRLFELSNKDFSSALGVSIPLTDRELKDIGRVTRGLGALKTASNDVLPKIGAAAIGAKDSYHRWLDANESKRPGFKKIPLSGEVLLFLKDKFTDQKPATPEVNITQHIHGVTDGADADSVGADHLKRAAIQAAKQISRGH